MACPTGEEEGSTRAGKAQPRAGGGVLLLLVLCAPLWTAGCRLTGASSAPEPSAESALAEYSSAVGEGARRLAAMDLSGSDLEDLAPSGQREEIERLARDFAAALEDYRAALQRTQPPWPELTGTALRLLERDFERRASQLEQVARAFEEGVRPLAQRARELTSAAGKEAAGRIRTALDYAACCEELSARMSDQRAYLIGIHEHGLRSPGADDHPAQQVLHFCLLERLDPAAAARHAAAHRRAWEGWIRRKCSDERPEAALELLASLYTDSSGRPPVGLEVLHDIMESCIDRPPAVSAIAAMERHLQEIERALRSSGGGSAGTIPEIDHARAVVMLSRAHGDGDPERAIQIALSALRQDSTLVEAVHRFVLEAGQDLIDKHSRNREYNRAFRAFSGLLAHVPERRLRDLAEQFRSYAIDRALADHRSARDLRRFEDARRILDDLGRLADRPSEREELRGLLHEHYLAYSRSLERTDPGAYLKVCQEMHREFPDDMTARRCLDRAYIQRMQGLIGDLKTAHRRLTADRVLEILREALSLVSTEEGVDTCQLCFRRIRDVWRAQLDQVRDPRDALRLSREIASLAGEGRTEERSRTRKVISRLITLAAAEERWGPLEQAVEAYLEEFEERPEVPSFQEIYLRLIHRLARTGESGKLARHLILFSAVFPRSAALVRPLLLDRLGPERSDHLSFFAILKKLQPHAQEVQEYERRHGILGFDVVQELCGLADPGTYPVLRGWIGQADGGQAPPADGGWFRGAAAQPPGRGGEFERGSGAEAVAGALSTEAEQRRQEWTSMIVAVGVCGSIIFPVLLLIATLRRGTFRFRWYGLTALWLGITVGILLGG